MAAFQNNFVPASPEPVKSKQTLKEVAAEAAKTLLEEKVLQKEPPPRPETDKLRMPLHPYQVAFTAFGLISIGLGIFAWTQHSHTRLAASAIGLGLIAIAWKWVLIAVGVAIAIFILSLLG